MASVTLDRVWINDGTDPSQARSFLTDGKPTDSRGSGAEVRTYAGGRRRVITSVGRSQSLPVTLALVSAADLAWLDARVGALVCFRDPAGRRVWGTYTSLTVDDYAVMSYGSKVALTIESVSHDEAVA